MEETAKKKSGLATAGLVLGIIGAVLSFIPIIRFLAYPLGGLAVIFGAICLFGKKSTGASIAALVLGIAAIILTVSLQSATVNAVDETVKEINKASSELSDSLDDISGDNTEKILKNDLDVTIGEFSIEENDFIDDYKLPVTIKNKGKEKASFSVKIEAVDAEGKRIDDDTVLVDTLNAGQSQNFEAFKLITSDTAENLKNATFKVVEVSKY